ncbi:hypothetical protein [Pseudarthrobacter oxydans]|uniref:hypothetical protein n=1 Tax=Pseudarthrobacter oxydans TaxID=1671 RepID=UPI002AA6CE05|nr:hypothetical protein [Pseudarthrobacter oxydans]WPU11053.1 hypothetical protein SMD14_08750 [Pseudarthrobacter oxydans]
MSIETQSASVAGIKNEVRGRLQEADPGIEVRDTEYFNNTYSPDFILKWPGEKETRRVFLRADSNPRYLAEDIEIVGDEQSILMPLAQSRPSEDPKLDETLQRDSAKQSVLIANADSVSALIQQAKASPYATLVSRALLQGGKGLVRRERAEHVVGSVSDGFQDASHSRTQHIPEAVEAAQGVLDTPRSNAISSFMQALWIASGERADTFPVLVASQPSLDTAALSFLLDMPELDDDEFWLRIGRNIEIEKILSLNLTGATPNLQRLMRMNAGRLRARVCRVVPSDAGKFRENEWFLGDGGLGLTLGSSSAIFTNSKIADITEEGISSIQPVSSVSMRAQAADIRIVALSIAARESRIDYAAVADIDISSDPQLGNVASALGSAAEVVSVTAAIGAADRRLSCNLQTSTSHGNSNAKYFLSEMAINSIPLFVDLSERQLTDLYDAVGAERSNEEPSA